MHMWIQRGGVGTGVPDLPSKITKIRVFLSNTGPNPLKIVKLPSQLSILGHNRHASETPFMKCICGSRGGTGVPDLPSKITKIRFFKQHWSQSP